MYCDCIYCILSMRNIPQLYPLGHLHALSRGVLRVQPLWLQLCAILGTADDLRHELFGLYHRLVHICKKLHLYTPPTNSRWSSPACNDNNNLHCTPIVLQNSWELIFYEEGSSVCRVQWHTQVQFPPIVVDNTITSDTMHWKWKVHGEPCRHVGTIAVILHVRARDRHIGTWIALSTWKINWH